jgi:hypothetical protein
MMSLATRCIAAIGIVLVIVSNWVSVFPSFKYWDDGTIGAFILILAIVTGVLLLSSLVVRSAGLSLAGAATGLVACGFLLFVPVEVAFGEFGLVRAGAWLGAVGGVLLGFGSLFAYVADRAAATAPFAISSPEPSAPAAAGTEPQPTPREAAAVGAASSDAAGAAPAGWYDDPAGQAGRRYWDGQQWTTQTSD